MKFVIMSVEHETQDSVLIGVRPLGTHKDHYLEFRTDMFYDLSPAEMLEEIRGAMKDKLASELNLQSLVGEEFTIDNIYRKAYAEDFDWNSYIVVPKD